MGADACGSSKKSVNVQKGPTGEWIERIYDYVIVSGSPKGKILQIEVVEDFESRPWSQEKRTGASRRCRRCCLLTVEERLPGRSTKEEDKEEGEVDEDGGERRIRSRIAQEVVEGIKEKVSVHGGIRKEEQSFMRSWDCSQIENEEEEESWREGDQMAARWDEVQKTGGDLGTKKDRRKKLLQVGGHAKGTGAGGALTHVTRQRGEGSKKEEERTRMVHLSDEGKTKYCCAERH